ncbi:RluA family pseudouridine synthase [Campylobacter sp. 19-13652]|uniref:RluA family pseudouridine synthase n=1 Tax=Campylobacter sp. 19-13652 TaxID=2840180 RepID=UPI001C779BDB|nr:RluA family pseudouridine synthase [Campylobacter sp. 19-13652]BCX79744.1 pseudouridine synthase [Campylobacter sp. 19-13652]
MLKFKALTPNRIDVLLSLNLNISRSQAANLIKSELVNLNSQIAKKPSQIVRIDDEIWVKKPSITPLENKFEVDFDVDIIYEDDDLLVLNKPSGITVHGAPSVKEATLVEWLNEKGFMLSNLNGEVRAGIVHRLDKGTSGAIVVAKNNAAHAALSAQLEDKSMNRIYLALIDFPLKEPCIIDRALARSSQNRLKIAVSKSGGKAAKSAFVNLITQADAFGAKRITNADSSTLISAKLFTGRTHQIRAHLASISRHILGDDLYGFKRQNGKIARIMLHAYMLNFKHPRTGELMSFIAPFDEVFATTLSDKFNQGLIDEKTAPKYLNNAFSDVSKWLCYT